MTQSIKKPPAKFQSVTHCDFAVDDAGGGAATRTFNFDTKLTGDHKVEVQITFPEGGSIPCELDSYENPDREIPSYDARVKPTGMLRLVSSVDVLLVLFSGTLHTMHSTSMDNVVVASLDLR
jgi:hypothetical protein